MKPLLLPGLIEPPPPGPEPPPPPPPDLLTTVRASSRGLEESGFGGRLGPEEGEALTTCLGFLEKGERGRKKRLLRGETAAASIDRSIPSFSFSSFLFFFPLSLRTQPRCAPRSLRTPARPRRRARPGAARRRGERGGEGRATVTTTVVMASNSPSSSKREERCSSSLPPPLLLLPSSSPGGAAAGWWESSYLSGIEKRAAAAAAAAVSGLLSVQARESALLGEAEKN